MAVDGTWNVTMKTPMGAQSATLELVDTGGTLSGGLKSPMGGADITEGSVDGDNLTFTVKMTSPMPMDLKFTATVDGDAISGKVALGPMGESSFEGTRA